jgi:hypothetical protein
MSRLPLGHSQDALGVLGMLSIVGHRGSEAEGIDPLSAFEQWDGGIEMMIGGLGPPR